MTVVSQVILNADDELRYPSSGELQSIADFLKTGADRVRIVETLTGSEKKIVELASRQLWQKRPDYIAPGGNAYGQKQRAQCLRDYGWYLRLVTYGILAGDTRLIEDIGLEGAREMYNSLGVPMPGMVEAMRCMRDVSMELLSSDEGAVARPYFDHLVQGMEFVS
jgi:allophycocyanin-B